MVKSLKVIKPFGTAEIGDVFELTDMNTYVCKNTWSANENDENETFLASVSQEVSISDDYAEMLVSNGYLSEENEKSFVNVFDEIENLAKFYDKELDNLEKDYENLPTCMKVEKETVLRNMLKVLEHLHSLKK